MKEVLPDGRVKYTYEHGRTVYVTPKPGRRKWERRPEPVRPVMLPDEERVLPMTHPFRDVRRQYKGQRKSR